ncbi:cadherin-5 [Leuresthes tenuis]|uniref:cadherin-5 n=1 Tax=Leuresthes tenuis TaxID=355514 RepID=UPI003B51200B
MMAWLQVGMAGHMTMLALCVFLALGLPEVAAEKDSVAIVKKESHPVLLRQKREWIWNSLFVQEEKEPPFPFKIGRLKSSQDVPVRSFKIEGEGANTIFTVDLKGDLFVTRSLDREEKAFYQLTAKMFDGNNKLIEDSGEFVVQVTDINDNIPVFPKSYNGSIMERSAIGTKVVDVRATDADDPTTANAELIYSLVQGTSAFEIKNTTGEIRCKINTLDRETTSKYVVVVKVQDMRGKPTGSTATTSVTITIDDTNDNLPSFTTRTYEITVPENHKLNQNITTLRLEDRDEFQNKNPLFSIPSDHGNIFYVELNENKDGNLMLKQALDYETKSSYSFAVNVRENLRFPAENLNSAVTTAQVIVRVLDVDEPPVFNQPIYTFTVLEEQIVNNFGKITAKDPDRANKTIQYSILDKDCPIQIHALTGQLSTLRKLDRELEATHVFQVKAQEKPSGLESLVKVNIIVQDVNDNQPEFIPGDIFVCENDITNTVIGILRGTDKDERPATFTFSLASQSSNFSIKDYGNNTAAIVVKQGPFSLDDPEDYSVNVRISDGGQPIQTSVTKVAIRSCQCDSRRITTRCKAGARRMGVSVHALIAILLCIVTILVIVILFVMRKRYQKDSLANMKNSGEIHEQLVTYDEEGGGEMDTNGYDVSILTSACHDGSLLRHPDHHPHPSLYAMVQKAPHHTQPTACKGDMAAMIEVKKDEADHDRDGYPYDTLHIYGYEGPESLAGSLSSLESSSTGSNLDYDFLNEWGPRFRALAELYGVDGSDYYHQY